ncbi:MAG: MBL fold metallo-hydrolase [Chitinivibrionales bacterium]|nr:MBL fold metallo-hydrolase [Chitinivibrionales bacterium]
MATGDALIRDIDTAEVRPGSLCFWWLGQQSFVVKTADAIIYLDPYLSDNARRRTPPLLRPEQIMHADLITGSHDHADHIDRPVLPTLMAASPPAVLIIPRAVAAGFDAVPDATERIVAIDDEESVRVGQTTVTAVRAAHEHFDRHDTLGYPYLGYVIESAGVTIYHAGDTCMWEGLVSRLQRWQLTAAFLPINGRDAQRLRRGCIGNMTYQEAVDLAGALKPEMVVPAHYDMFDDNSEDPRLFVEYLQVKYPGVRCWVGEHATRVTVTV